MSTYFFQSSFKEYMSKTSHCSGEFNTEYSTSKGVEKN